MLVAAGAVACGSGEARPVAMTGAGATFPYPVYSKWFSEFHRATGTQINYQSIGSGAGVKQFLANTVDFGATDGPMSDEEIASATDGVLHLPTVLGAVVLTWNLPALGAASLKLDGTTIADIFLGRIKRWNDPRLTALNPGVALPDQELLVVHRSDGSGTSFIFTDYLAKVSPTWRDSVGVGKAINWPIGLGGNGNEGVTQQIKQVTGTIGYVELVYAVSNNLPVADIRNSSGQFVTPSLASVTAAAAGVALPADTDFRVSIVDAAGADAYPISSFTWLLVRPRMADAAKATALREFLTWMTTPEAAAMASELHYAPLPESIAAAVRARISSITGQTPAP
jgi:phosphate transport system substrate-binding protein